MTAPYMGTFSIPYNTKDILGSYSSAQRAAKGRDRALALAGMMTDTSNPLDKLLAYRKERQIAPAFQEARIAALAGDNYAEKQFQQQLLSQFKKKEPSKTIPEAEVGSPYEYLDTNRDMSGRLEDVTRNRLQTDVRDFLRGGARYNPNKPTFSQLAERQSARGTQTLEAETGMYDIPEQGTEEQIMGLLSEMVGTVSSRFGNEGGGGAVISATQTQSTQTPITALSNIRFMDPFEASVETSLQQPLDLIAPNTSVGETRPRARGGGGGVVSSGTLAQVDVNVETKKRRGRPPKARPVDPTQTRITEFARGGERYVEGRGSPPIEQEEEQSMVQQGKRRSKAAKSKGAKGQLPIQQQVLDEEQLAEAYSQGMLGEVVEFQGYQGDVEPPQELLMERGLEKVMEKYGNVLEDARQAFIDFIKRNPISGDYKRFKDYIKNLLNPPRVVQATTFQGSKGFEGGNIQRYA